MSSHIVDYARSQLEWMKDTLSKSFYNEKPNPFALPNVTIIQTMKELNAINGPKIVLCTDASFNCGLSKDLLLKWSGDKRNKVIFTDYPDRRSLAFTLLAQSFTPPVIVQVTHPERVMISGDELLQYLEVINRENRNKEEIVQRTKIEEELIKVCRLFKLSCTIMYSICMNILYIALCICTELHYILSTAIVMYSI
jgi:Cft2 family RNA processing exonuclease